MSKQVPYTALPDTDLVEQYRQTGDQECVAALYQRYAGQLFGVCLKYLKDPDAAADACADLYTQLVSKLLQHQVDYFKGWLFVVAKNHCLQILRQAKNMSPTDLDITFMQSNDEFHLEEVMRKESQLNSLQDCLEKLNNVQRDAVTLFYLKEMSYQEIAGHTGEAWNTVRSHIQNGRRNLKNCMENAREEHA